MNMEQLTDQRIPPSLPIASAPPNYTNQRPVSSHPSGGKPQSFTNRPNWAQEVPDVMAQPEGRRNWPTLNASLKMVGRGSQEQDRSPVQSLKSNSPASPSPNSASSHKPWSLRRSGSALSPTSSKQQLQEDGLPSPKENTKRPSRFTSFIRRHHSSNIEDTEPQHPGLNRNQYFKSPYQQSYRAYSQLDISRPQELVGNSGSGLSTLPLSSTSAWGEPLRPSPSFSPVADNPFAPWIAKERPQSAGSVPVLHTMALSAFASQPPVRNFSDPSAPATSFGSSQQVLDTSANVEAEPEPFTSPSEFALFAEATSSLGFMPVEPLESAPLPVAQAQTWPPQHAPQQHATQHSIPRPSTIRPNHPYLQPVASVPSLRSRSVPPSNTHTHIRSSSGSNVSTLRPTTRSQALAEALVGMDGDQEPLDEEEELPDYETSQAEAHASARGEASRRARELEERWQRGRAERAWKPWRGWEPNSWTQ